MYRFCRENIPSDTQIHTALCSPGQLAGRSKGYLRNRVHPEGTSILVWAANLQLLPPHHLVTIAFPPVFQVLTFLQNQKVSSQFFTFV